MSEDDRAEFTEPVAAQVVCAACNQPVVQSYYEFAGTILCSPCREKREQALDGFGDAVMTGPYTVTPAATTHAPMPAPAPAPNV